MVILLDFHMIIHVKNHVKSFSTHSQVLEELKSDFKYKIAKGGRVGVRFLAHNTLRGRGPCYSFGMGLGRVDKLHSLTWACTQRIPEDSKFPLLGM